MSDCAFVADVCKPSGVRRQFSLRLTQHLARLWEPSTIYFEDDVVRPRDRETGYELRALNHGQSRRMEPNWKEETVDGSITWQRQPISNDSLLRTVVSVDWTAPSGLVVEATGIENVGGKQVISVALSGGTVEDSPYLVTAAVTYSDAQTDLLGLRVAIEELGV